MTEPAEYPVIWSPRARANLQAIDEYIGQFAPLAAQRFTMRLASVIASLASNPRRGRSLRGGVRELVIVHPYCIRYRVTRSGVQVLRIRHGAQRPD